jgi:hypothetical protein
MEWKVGDVARIKQGAGLLCATVSKVFPQPGKRPIELELEYTNPKGRTFTVVRQAALCLPFEG